MTFEFDHEVPREKGPGVLSFIGNLLALIVSWVVSLILLGGIARVSWRLIELGWGWG